MVDKYTTLPPLAESILRETIDIGREVSKIYDIMPNQRLAFRSLSAEEEIDVRVQCSEYRGPAYIIRYKVLTLARAIAHINGLDIPLGSSVKLERWDPEKRENRFMDVPIAVFLEEIIGTWSKGLIDLSFKIYGLHSQNLTVALIDKLGMENVMTKDELEMSREMLETLRENDEAHANLSPLEKLIALDPLSSADDIALLGSRVVTPRETEIDYKERPDLHP